MRILLSLLTGLFFVCSAHASDPFTLTSTSFSDHNKLPPIYTCDGRNISPNLGWKNAPLNTVSFAIVLSNPSSPGGVFYNWIVYNIPAQTTQLLDGEENLPPDAIIAENSYGDIKKYAGPCPSDANPSEYVFEIYALDKQFDIAEDLDPEEVIAKFETHTLSKAQLTVTYAH